MISQVRLKAPALTIEVYIPSEARTVTGWAPRFSVGDAFVCTYERVKSGTEVIVQLVLPGGTIRAEGMVAATTPPPDVPGFTVVFEEVLPADRARIAAAIGNAA